MEAVNLKPNHPKQMQILVGKCRVGYVCFGDRMPINFLPPKVTRISLTDEEKLEVAEQTRNQMSILTQEREGKAAKLASLTGRDFGATDTTEPTADEVDDHDAE